MTQLAHNDGASGVQAGLDSGPPRFTCRDLVHGYTTADIEADRAQVGWYSSLTRVIEGAPRQNKLTVFSLLARESAAYSAAHRQRVIDELWEIATSFGLVDLFDTASVQDTISVAFDDGPPMGMVPRKPAESPYPQTVSDEDDYDGLGRSFARACRDADREYRQAPRSPAKRANNRLPESTRQAVEWLLKNNDAERLKDFIAEHSPSEAQVIVGYIKGRRS